MAKVVVIDDELTMVQMVTELLRADGHEVAPFTNSSAALEFIENQGCELVITDLNLTKSGVQGMDILQKSRGLNPPPIVIVITAFGSIGSAVQAMKVGAYDYLTKPFKLDDFKLCVHRALSYNEAVSETRYLRRQLKDQNSLRQIVGGSAKMQEVFRLIERVADTDCTVLILGESGTGKELVARALHGCGRRALAPFIPLNCAALPENLLESELFGHRKGAFTGAVQDKKGLFEEAAGGTLFLDEIGCMPAVLQSRLLRVLQDKEVRRVGDNTAVYVNVRVLAATNAPLEQKIKEGTFREDLYYRLNVFPIPVPSLRERRDDIPLLVAHLLKSKVDARSGRPFEVTRQTMATLCAYDWPGNVRELQNVIERATVLCESNLIRIADLSPAVAAAAPAGLGPEPDHVKRESVAAEAVYPLNYPVDLAARPSAAAASAAPLQPLKEYIQQQELMYLNRVLAATSGDKEKAAQMLGISLATLYRKLAEDAPA
jgi:DNA-binding NtrC family response regulator